MKEHVLKLYPHAYCRKHVRRTYFETDKKGIYSDTEYKQFNIFDESCKLLDGGKLANTEYEAWHNAWQRISDEMMFKLEK